MPAATRGNREDAAANTTQDSGWSGLKRQIVQISNFPALPRVVVDAIFGTGDPSGLRDLRRSDPIA
jgi:NAD(P)H-hydrate repair Nnr-like enzyme with NAD(P)H-hydrate epimerase domain